MPSPIVRPVAKRIYDVAVLGPDVGGAATAALCSRRGLRALLPRAEAASALGLLARRGQKAFEIGVIESVPGLPEPEVVVT